ncbi:hypothetical protein HDU83_005786 [Entophlyctis luteolus]|nr:hypothetical protein HDU82_001695 [Entophlyctis luteolus]KAJ3354180.1 hypothetical protein HDU83_005786 [Entophlyctis luteolus]KAJ3392697.1 hypothetical protein HDU84_003703 [Entophlyctis sp. JEL0112]
MPAPKPVVAVDMDEVLCATNQALIDFHNANYDTQLEMKDFVSYNYEEIWGGTRKQAIDKVRLFYASDHFSERMQVVPGARVALETLKDWYDLVVVTARQEVVHQETHLFLRSHFPDIFTDVHFANHYLTPEEAARMVSKTKGELCQEVGAKILIDDSLQHARECAAKGIRVFLFDHEGEYGWNKLPDGMHLPDNVSRVHKWDEVVEALRPPE